MSYGSISSSVISSTMHSSLGVQVSVASSADPTLEDLLARVSDITSKVQNAYAHAFKLGDRVLGPVAVEAGDAAPAVPEPFGQVPLLARALYRLDQDVNALTEAISRLERL